MEEKKSEEKKQKSKKIFEEVLGTALLLLGIGGSVYNKLNGNGTSNNDA